VKYISVPEDPLPNREWTICLFLFALQPFFLDRMKRMRDLAACDRPRENDCPERAQALSDHELIAAIIGHGTPNRDVFSLAKDIVGLFREIRCDNIRRSRWPPGHRQSKASQILASFELARRYIRIEEEAKVHIQQPADVLPFRLGSQRKEPRAFSSASRSTGRTK